MCSSTLPAPSDPRRSGLMPPPVLVSQSCISAPGLFTPAIQLHPHDDRSPVKQRLADAPGASGYYGTAPLRDGLPTPPSDMTGVAYNALPSSSYGGQLNRASLRPYSSNSRSTLDPLPSAMVPSVKPQGNPGSTPNTLVPVPTDQKPFPNTSVAAAPQIPPSVNSSRGSVAEFAAQVRI